MNIPQPKHCNCVANCNCGPKLYSVARGLSRETSVTNYELPIAKAIKAFDAARNNTQWDYQTRCWASIMRKREVISVGWNQRKSHPKQAMYSTSKHRIFLHAEIHAIIRARQSVERCDMFVFRWLKDLKFGESSPCNGCMAAMSDAGIQSVTFFNDGKFVRMAL